MKERWPEMLEYQQKVQAMTDLERARWLLPDGTEEVEVRELARVIAAARREGEEAMRERAAAECERHAKFCQEEADRGGDRVHLFIRFEEATYNAQRIRTLPLTPEEPA